MKSILNPLELYACLAIWIFSNVYFTLKLYLSQSEILDDPVSKNVMTDLQPGWIFLRRLKDTSDEEWRSFKFFIHTSWSYLIVQFITTEIIRRTKISYLKYWHIISSIIFVGTYMGFRQLLLILMQLLLYATIILSGGKKWSIWITSLALLVFYNSIELRKALWLFLFHDNMHNEVFYLFTTCLLWIELRCISYSLDYLEKSKKCFKNSSNAETLVNMLSYCLYVPLLYTGPIILYEDFQNCFYKPTEKLSFRLKKFFTEMCILIIYTLMLDLALHYIYFTVIRVNMQMIRMLPTLALCGGGVWMGEQFYLKYVIVYGTSSAFARLDNMETPPAPRCIARIHVYSQMWKYFDVGLYRFLVKYIYRPSCKVILTRYNLSKITSKLIASSFTFVFIFLWHGASKPILIWSILNYLGVTLEYLCRELSETNKYKWFKKNILKTESMEARFLAMLCSPMLFTSVVSNLYLFTHNTSLGNYIFEYFYHQSFDNLDIILVLLALYCCSIVSMALQDVPSRPYLKKVKL